MTAREGAALIGKPALYPVKGMTFTVTIKDVRTTFGRTDVLIVPTGGHGETWVSLDNLKLNS